MTLHLIEKVYEGQTV